MEGESMKREYAMLMKASLDFVELSAVGRRRTRSRAVVSPVKGTKGCAGEVGDGLGVEGKSKRVKTEVDEEMMGLDVVVSSGKGVVGLECEVGDVLVENGLNMVKNGEVEGKLKLVKTEVDEEMIDLDVVVSSGKEVVGLACEVGDVLVENGLNMVKNGEVEGKLKLVKTEVDEEMIDLEVVSSGKEVVGLACEVGDGLAESELNKVKKDAVVGSSENGLMDVEIAVTGKKEEGSLVGSCAMLTPVKAESGVVNAVGCEESGEGKGALVKISQRRFTRSTLRNVKNEVTGKELGVGKVESGVDVASTSRPLKLEMKMSKKVGLAKLPSKLNDLLHTGLLEGLNVRYIRGTKTRPRPDSELKGVVQGVGILCSCGECKGEKVISPNQFEVHAGSGHRSPPDYIYLENGKSLRDVLNTCKVAHSDSLEMVIRNAIGRSESTTNVFCLTCKGLISEDGAGRRMLFCDSCIPEEWDSSSSKIVFPVTRSPIADSPAQVGSSQLETRISAQGSSNSQSRTKSQGKITKKDLGMHKIVFSEDVLPNGTVLNYVVKGMKRLEGYKQDDGIFCSCCEDVVSASQFESHAGFASRRKPYDHIFMSNGLSLHKLAVELTRKRKSTVNDDLCSICGEGGDLLCCDTCPRAFHAECVDLESVPEGSWYCRYCDNMFERSKLEERSENAIAAGRVPGADPLKEITQRCIRIVETLSDVGGCAICSGRDFTKKVFDDRTVIICDQCEKDYHVGCLRQRNMADLKEVPSGDWFCSDHCNNINSTLCKLIEEGEQSLPVAVSDIARKKKSEEQGLEPTQKIDLKWRLLKGKDAPGATRKPLSDAVSIFHEGFGPIADSSTASHDLIPHLVYGRLFKGKDYQGMHCAILIANSVVVSAVIFRIFGENVAEIPLVATRSDYQGKGYFQCLFSCIENLLTSLGVKNLVLPAADEAEAMWTDRFGFKKVDEEQVRQYRKQHQHMLIFQESSILHKPISKPGIMNQSTSGGTLSESKFICTQTAVKI